MKIDLPEVLLFDADGTLYLSEHLNFEANRRTARELHDFDFTWELYDKHIRLGSMSSDEVMKLQGIDVDPKHYIATKSRHYEAISADELVAVPGARDFLEWAKAARKRCYIISAARRSTIEASLDILGMAEFFEAIVSNEDIKNRKPHPDPFLLGLQLAGVNADRALVFEDTDKGIASAKAAGLRCVGIQHDINTAAELAEADLILKDYRELLK